MHASAAKVHLMINNDFRTINLVINRRFAHHQFKMLNSKKKTSSLAAVEIALHRSQSRATDR